MTVLNRFFRSVAGKVFAVLLLCLSALLLLNLLFNNFAFLHVYENEQTALLTTAYRDTAAAIAKRQDIVAVLEPYHTEHNMTATVLSAHQVLYTTERLTGPLIMMEQPPAIAAGTYTVTSRSQANGTTLTLYGKTPEGIYVMLQLPLGNMRDTIAVANRSLWWITAVLLAVSLVLALFVARVFTRPIRRLSGMATQMARLDFSARYTGNGQDELADLGRSLNTVSETMEQSLSELKTANLRLQQDMEQTARQNEAHARFIRNVSHELKTPIALIQTYAEGLHENIAADPADRAYYCTVIEDEAQKLSQLLMKLNTLMQLESGSEELTIERFDLAALITRVLQRYAPLFAQRAVALPSLPSEPCFVWGDALLIEQVVTNYLTNALHHVSENGRIEVLLQVSNGNAVRLSVFNTGEAIPEDDLPHIWESFYKVDKARTRAYGGTGIGLSVVAAILNVHNAPYGVRNLTDGVEFYMELQL
ncbi:MAG: HAMP domain-containing histidine kinase [Clostridia bacterium]|nr:HAMP domain-containing histidine kinase [Clostridia bacterium]